MARFGDLECGTIFAHAGKIYVKERTYSGPRVVAYGMPLPCYGNTAQPFAADDDVDVIGLGDMMSALDALMHNKRVSEGALQIPQRLPPYRKLMTIAKMLAEYKRRALPLVTGGTAEAFPMGTRMRPTHAIRKMFSCRRSFISAAYAYAKMPPRQKQEFTKTATEMKDASQSDIEKRIREVIQKH